MRMFLVILLGSVLQACAVINYYVDTDTGNNGNDGSSWALAKADLYHAVAGVGSVSDAVIIHCRGATADTNAVPGYINGTSPSMPLTIQTDATNRHSGVWDDGKYHLVLTDNGPPVTIANQYENVYGLQIKLVTSAVTFIHGIAIQSNFTNGVINLSDNIIRASLGAVATDDVGIHTGPYGTTNYIWNNVIYGWINGLQSDCIAMALYGNDRAFNNTIYNCYTGFYNGVGSTNQVLSINNLFVSVTRPLAGNFTGTFRAGTDYNATDGSALLISPMTVTGGDGAHEQLNIATSGLFANAGSGNFNLTDTATTQVRTAGQSDPGVGLFADDITGVARTIWDIGAFAYQQHAILSRSGPGRATGRRVR